MYDMPPPEPPTVQWCTTTTNFPTHQIWEQCQEIIKNDPVQRRRIEYSNKIFEVCSLVNELMTLRGPYRSASIVTISVDGKETFQCEGVESIKNQAIRRNSRFTNF